MKTLLVYFLRTGNTAALAEGIASGCGADLEPIKEFGKRQGIAGYVRSLWQAATHKETLIAPGTHAPKSYDLVILGTPVWGWNMSSPVRSYIRNNCGQVRNLALFCTYGGSGESAVFSDMQKLCGSEVIATLAVKTAELQGKQHRARLEHFIQEVK